MEKVTKFLNWCERTAANNPKTTTGVICGAAGTVLGYFLGKKKSKKNEKPSPKKKAKKEEDDDED